MKIVWFLMLISLNICFAQNQNQNQNHTNLAKRLERRRSYYFKKRQDSDDFIVKNRVSIPLSDLTELKTPSIEKKTTYETFAIEKTIEDDVLNTKNHSRNYTEGAVEADKNVTTSGINQTKEYNKESIIPIKMFDITAPAENVTHREIDSFKENVKLEVNENKISLDNVFKNETLEEIDPKLVQQFMEEVTKYGQMCIEEVKASNDDIAQLMAHKIPDSHEGKCVISCVYKKFKLQNEDGTMNYEQTQKMMEKVKESDQELYDKMSTVFKNCQKPEFNDPDHCTTAVKVAACAVVEAKLAGISSEMLGL